MVLQCRRLLKIPGIGEITATALVAAVPNANEFKNGRHMSAWLGLVPRQSSSGVYNSSFKTAVMVCNK